MFRKWIALGFLFAFAAFAGFLAGCGQQQATTGGGTPTAAEASVSGTASVTQTDLSQLGVGALSVGGSKPLAQAVQSGTVEAFEVTTTGIGTSPVATGTWTSAGATTAAYSISGLKEDTNYLIKITFLGAAKKIVVKTWVYIEAGQTTLTGVEVSNQTATVVEAIAENIATQVQNLDAKTLYDVVKVLIATTKKLIDSGVISIGSAVQDKDKDEYGSGMDNVVDQFKNSDDAGKYLDGLELEALLKKARTDLESGKKAFREIIKTMKGDSNVPDLMITSFAQAYLDGKTTTPADLVTAINKVKFGATDLDPATFLSNLNTYLSNFQSNLGSFNAAGIAASAATTIPDVPPVMVAIYSSIKNKMPLTSSTQIEIHELMLLMHYLFDIQQFEFDPFGLFVQLGFISAAGTQPMGYDVRVMQFFDPATLGQNNDVLISFLALWNADPAKLANVSATLTYPTAAGGTNTVAYTKEAWGPAAVQAQGGMSEVHLMIDPWMGGQQITDFKKDLNQQVTINISGVPGETIAPLTTTYSYINVGANVVLDTPKQVDWSQPQNATMFPEGTVAIEFKWHLDATPSIPSGDSLLYALRIMKEPSGGTLSVAGIRAFQGGYLSDMIYDSHQPGRGKLIDGTSFKLEKYIDANGVEQPVSGLAAGNYFFDMNYVVLDSIGKEIFEGGFVGAPFSIGTQQDYQNKTSTATYEVAGSVTFSATTSATAVNAQQASSIKVGLFNMGQFYGDIVTPLKIAALSNANNYSISFTLDELQQEGYDLIAWEDTNGNGALDFSSGEIDTAGQSNKHIMNFGSLWWELWDPGSFGTIIDQGPMAEGANSGFDIDMSVHPFGPPPATP